MGMNLATAFDAQRPRLLAVAGRMLGSRWDAEDAVQEAWFRLARQDTTAIDNLVGWLTTVVGRVCIDILRARAARPETLFGDALPELVITPDDDSPESNAIIADAVGTALLIVLETLDAAERLAFVLHDLFAVPFEEIGPIVGKSANASKMLASRARRKVQGTEAPSDRRGEQRAIVDEFLRAARGGDFDGLLRILDPNVTSRIHTARGVSVLSGAEQVAVAAKRGGRASSTNQPVLVNGVPGIVARAGNGSIVGVMACAVENGRIVDIVALTDRDRLDEIQLNVGSK